MDLIKLALELGAVYVIADKATKAYRQHEEKKQIVKQSNRGPEVLLTEEQWELKRQREAYEQYQHAPSQRESQALPAYESPPAYHQPRTAGDVKTV